MAVRPTYPGASAGVTPLTATITASAQQDWPAQVQPTVTPAGGDKSYTYSSKLLADGIDYSARLSATNTANPTFTPTFGHREWVFENDISDGSGQTITKVYRLTLGDADGWCTPDLTGGTLVDTNGYLVSRTATQLTIKDTVQANADRAYIYWDITSLLPAQISTIQTRFVQGAANYTNDWSIIGDMQITNDRTALDGATHTIAAGAYYDAFHFMRMVLATTKDGSQQNAAYYGTQSSAVFGEDQESAGYMVACPVDANGAPIGALGHKEVSAVALDYSTPANIYAVASSWSFEVKNGGVDKTVGDVWQIRIRA